MYRVSTREMNIVLHLFTSAVADENNELLMKLSSRLNDNKMDNEQTM